KLPNKNRMILFVLALILFWAKTILAYYTEFNQGVSGAVQTFMLWINPFATSMILLSLSLYFKDTKKSGYSMLVMYFIISLLLYTNVLYYREFADFMTLSTILGNLGLEGGSNVSSGLITSFFVMLRVWDIAYW